MTMMFNVIELHNPAFRVKMIWDIDKNVVLSTVDVAVDYTHLMLFLLCLQLLVARKIMQLCPLVTLRLLVVRIKLMKTVVVFPTPFTGAVVQTPECLWL